MKAQTFAVEYPKCKRTLDYINFDFSYICNIHPKVTNVKNIWKQDHYEISVELLLPKYYQDEIEKTTCSLNWKGIDNCQKTKTSISTLAKLRWNISDRIKYESGKNLENSSHSIVLKELSTKSNFKLEYKVPQPEYTKENYVFPISAPYRITQRYGDTNYSPFHSGIDIISKNGDIKAVNSGTVVYSGLDNFSSFCNNGGSIIKIKHSNGIYSSYFHLKNIYVKKGDFIKRGQIVGVMGNSGKLNCKDIQTHLHLEIRNGRTQKSALNPLLFF